MPEHENESESESEKDKERTPAEIEAEIAAKRAHLEEDLAQLAHKVREKVDVPARIEKEVRRKPWMVFAAAGVALLLGAMLGARRARMNRAFALLDAVNTDA